MKAVRKDLIQTNKCVAQQTPAAPPPDLKLIAGIIACRVAAPRPHAAKRLWGTVTWGAALGRNGVGTPRPFSNSYGHAPTLRLNVPRRPASQLVQRIDAEPRITDADPLLGG